MPVVVDASAIAAIIFDEGERRVLASHLEGQTLLAPGLLDLELVNIALKKVRKYPDLLPAIAASLQRALKLPIARRAVPGDEVFALAVRTGLTSYDASYLWLAQLHDVELVSLDKPLMRHASA